MRLDSEQAAKLARRHLGAPMMALTVYCWRGRFFKKPRYLVAPTHGSRSPAEVALLADQMPVHSSWRAALSALGVPIARA